MGQRWNAWSGLALVLVGVGCRAAPSSDKAGALVSDGDGLLVDEDNDGIPADEDCNDFDPAVGPASTEICNGVDDNCDGVVDEGVRQMWWADADGDGFGDAGQLVESCEPPSGFVNNDADCDDANVDVFPGAVEACNDVDDNCDGAVDEGLGGAWFADTDGDGFGDAAVRADSCTPGDGFVADATDCDDDNRDVFPGAPEVCNDIDDNCDGVVDEGVANTYFLDADQDGWGGFGGTVDACVVPVGYAEAAGDCADDDPAVHPGATEVCNGIDDNCDGAVDDADASLDLSSASVWNLDADSDGFGSPSATVRACVVPAGAVADGSDCNDADAAVFPGATEVCNTIDDDCDGAIDDADTGLDRATAATWARDADSDGYGDPTLTMVSCVVASGYVGNTADCDDSRASVNPSATEVCNGIDDDCDAAVDDDDSSLDTATGSLFYGDADADGYGSPSASMWACQAPAGTVSSGTDCDDSAAAVHPGATEVCNGIDDNCNLLTDDSDPGLDTSTGSLFYTDGDSDGYGVTASAVRACVAPSGTVVVNGDCDDSAGSVFPGAPEVCNGADDDCDGTPDDGVLGSGTACAGASCADILLAGSSTGDGTYTVEGVSGAIFDVWCDMTTDGGGWTLAGSVVNEGSRHWNSYAAFTDNTTFGSIGSATSADFKGPAWTDIEGDDFLVATTDYDVGWYGVLGNADVASWVAGEYNAAVCSTTFLGHTPDVYDGLTTAQASSFSLTVRPLDDNCDCFPGCNESVLIGLTNARCCWVAGLGNAPNGQADWRTHDLSLLKVANVVPMSCSAGAWPCNADGAYANDSYYCYDTSCKQSWAEVYIR